MNITSNTSCLLHRVVVRLAIVVAVFCLSSAHGQFLVSGDFSSGNLFNDTVGYAFTVKQEPLSVHRLGVNDVGTNGLDSINLIGLWQEGGTLLASAIIPSGRSAPLEGGFRWFDLSTPVLLQANTTYRLGAQANLETRFSGFFPAGGTSLSPDVTLVGAVRNSQFQNFTYPGSTPFSGQAIIGPNLAYTVVPEPSTLALVVAAAIAILVHRRINLRRRLIRVLRLR
jgi:PEP-CTERM motif